jgi:heavy metal translocating P-type ATPase
MPSRSGDRLVVRAGEIVPTDGTVLSADAVIDTAALTGEPLPAHMQRGDDIASGSVNAGATIEIAATHPAGESTFAALVRLVQDAERAQAPFVRMADRYAGWFLPVAVGLAGLAWLVSGDPVRAVAVLVIATPCPLILAAPVALVSAVSRTARAGVIVKGAPVIETLAETRTILLDKTGTLTLGTPTVERVESLNGMSESDLLQLAASADQASPHVVARAIVAEARTRGLSLSFPAMPHETPGQGLMATVDGHRVAVGSASFITTLGYTPPGPGSTAGAALVHVVVDNAVAGTIHIADRLRAESNGLVERLRSAGVDWVLLVTGDRRAVADEVAAATGVDHVYSEMSAEAKLDLLNAIRAAEPHRGIAMAGDGINDAPALAAADTGIAVGTSATVATQVADAVIVSDRVDRIADAIRISRRSMHIARQSVVAGLGLSMVGMLLALAGLLQPIAGAFAQEAIDVAVILNALRALSD